MIEVRTGFGGVVYIFLQADPIFIAWRGNGNDRIVFVICDPKYTLSQDMASFLFLFRKILAQIMYLKWDNGATHLISLEAM